MHESAISHERLDNFKRTVGKCAAYSTCSIPFLKQFSGYGADGDTPEDAELVDSAIKLQKDVHERLNRMIKDVHVLFMVYQNFDPKYFKQILRNAAVQPSVQENIQNLKWSVTRLIKALNALGCSNGDMFFQPITHGDSYPPLWDCLHTIYGTADYFEEIRTESQMCSSIPTENYAFYELLKSPADGIVQSCEEFYSSVG